MQIYSPRCPLSSGRLLKHPVICRATRSPPSIGAPALPRSCGPPFSRVPPCRGCGESTEGFAGQVASWGPADHGLAQPRSLVEFDLAEPWA